MSMNAGDAAAFPPVRMAGITKRFPGVTANDAVDLDLHAGEVHGLLGENGAGKTTLMNMLFGLYTPDEGQILINGRAETIASPDFAPEPVVELWDLISKQDWEICERAQTGVGSRAYRRGGVYPRKDRFLFAFNEHYRRQMGRPTIG